MFEKDLAELNDKLQRIEKVPTDNFIELMELAGLDSRTDFVGMDLSETSLAGLSLAAFNFAGANLSRADLRRANLEGAVLDGANLEGAVLDGADLGHASLKAARLVNASLRKVNLKGTDLSGADTAGAVITRRLLFDPREQLIEWLQDAYAMEKGCLHVLEDHARDVADLPEQHLRYTRYLEETKRHADQVVDMIERLGGSTPVTRTTMGSVKGFFQGLSSGSTPGEGVKNLLTDYSATHFQIATYKTLIVAGRALGEVEIVRTCENILRDEEDMARWLEHALPALVESHVGQTSRTQEPAW